MKGSPILGVCDFISRRNTEVGGKVGFILFVNWQLNLSHSFKEVILMDNFILAFVWGFRWWNEDRMLMASKDKIA